MELGAIRCVRPPRRTRPETTRFAREAELLVLAQRGNNAALDQLVESLRPLVASLCRSHCCCPADVEDAIADTFVKFIVHLPELRPSDAWKGWLAVTACTVSADYNRKRLRE